MGACDQKLVCLNKVWTCLQSLTHDRRYAFTELFTTTTAILIPASPCVMSSNRWSLSRVWGGPRLNASTSGSTTAGPSSNRSRTAPSQTTNSSQHHRRQSASNGHPTSGSQPRRAQPASRAAASEEPQYSSPTVPDSLWFAQDFMLGAGMVIIQPSTKKVVVLSEKAEASDGRAYRYWFLPKGRKDVGESLEQTALREAYEEVRALSFPTCPPSCIIFRVAK